VQQIFKQNLIMMQNTDYLNRNSPTILKVKEVTEKQVHAKE